MAPSPSYPIQNEKFGKAYKLCSDKQITALFKTGKKLFSFPFSAHFHVQEEQKTTPFQVVIAVPKRNFKKAHDRNRIKRKIREQVRRNKLILESFLLEEQVHLSIFLMFTHKEDLSSEDFSKKIKQLFTQLQEKIVHEK